MARYFSSLSLSIPSTFLRSVISFSRSWTFFSNLSTKRSLYRPCTSLSCSKDIPCVFIIPPSSSSNNSCTVSKNPSGSNGLRINFFAPSFKASASSFSPTNDAVVKTKGIFLSFSSLLTFSQNINPSITGIRMSEIIRSHSFSASNFLRASFPLTAVTTL